MFSSAIILRRGLAGDDIDGDEGQSSAADAQENADMFLQNEDALDILQMFLEPSHSVLVRVHTLRLLLQLLRQRTSLVQEAILSRSGFIKILIELLGAAGEILRNEAILVMEALVTGNAAIQGICAFNGIFEILLGIAKDEGGHGIVADDCYTLILALIRENVSNVNYFREVGCIQRLFPLLLSVQKAFHLKSPPPGAVQRQTSDPGVPPVPAVKPTASLSLLFDIITVVDAGQRSQAQLATIPAIDAYFSIINDGDLPSDIACGLLRIIGRSVLCCPASRTALSSCRVNGLTALVHVLRIALDGHDINQCSNALFLLESFYYDNEKAQVAAVSALAPHPSDVAPSSIAPLLVQSLELWRNDPKSFRDSIRYWITTRLLSLLVRRNETAKQIALSTAIAEPVDERPAQRLMDSIVRTIQAAFDTSHADARVRSSLLLLLCECLADSSESVSILLGSAHLTESLLAVAPWTSTDVVVSGLGTFVWALCLVHSDIETFRPTLRRVVTSVIGVDRFKMCLQRLRASPELAKVRDEPCWEPMPIMQLVLFDSYFSSQFEKVVDLCDSRLLLIVIKRDGQADDSVPEQPRVIPSSVISDELIAARSRIAELESSLQAALDELADKTDDVALTRYRLDLVQQELRDLSSKAGHPVSDGDRALEMKLGELRTEHNVLLDQHNDLLLLLAAYEDPGTAERRESNNFIDPPSPLP